MDSIIRFYLAQKNDFKDAWIEWCLNQPDIESAIEYAATARNELSRIIHKNKYYRKIGSSSIHF